MARFPFLDHPGPLAFAHRGGAGEWPENTMPAFAAAVTAGYRYLETDVHVTSDGVLLAFHDEGLDRVTDRAGLIREQPWSVVREARVDGREPIPVFAELLSSFPYARFNIDPKDDSAVEPLAKVIRESGAIERVNVASFSDRRIARLRELLGPELCTGMGPKAIARLRAASFGAPMGAVTAGCVQVPVGHGKAVLVDERFVRTAHRLDLQVHVWTIDDAAEMERLLDLGVDGLMTDLPLVLKQVLVDRSQWVEAPASGAGTR